MLLRVGQGVGADARARRRLARGGRATTRANELFYLYALLPLAVGFVAEQLRVASAQTILDQRGLDDAAGGRRAARARAARGSSRAIVRREIGVMALSALVVVFLALRAAGTAHGF